MPNYAYIAITVSSIPYVATLQPHPLFLMLLHPYLHPHPLFLLLLQPHPVLLPVATTSFSIPMLLQPNPLFLLLLQPHPLFLLLLLYI